MPFVMHLLQRQSILNQFQLPLILYSNYTRCTFLICLTSTDFIIVWKRQTALGRTKKKRQSRQNEHFQHTLGPFLWRTFRLFQPLQQKTWVLQLPELLDGRLKAAGETIKIELQARTGTRRLLLLNQVVSAAELCCLHQEHLSCHCRLMSIN